MRSAGGYAAFMNDYIRIAKVIQFLDENFKEQPSLKELARVAGLSEFHFQRLFSRWTGTTPKSYLQFLTAKRAKELLLESKDLLSVSFETGLSGPGRLHDLMISLEAMTPGEFKARGAGIEIRYGVGATPFGDCLIGVTKRGICHLAFFDSEQESALADMKRLWPNALFKPAKTETARVLKRVFGGAGKGSVSLLVRGTPFQIKVWEALLRVPEGTVISYDRLARLAGVPGASRAVGTAVGKNSIAYLIPCHRVIRETGVLGQYRWGAIRKKAVLNWETLRTRADGEGP